MIVFLFFLQIVNFLFDVGQKLLMLNSFMLQLMFQLAIVPLMLILMLHILYLDLEFFDPGVCLFKLMIVILTLPGLFLLARRGVCLTIELGCCEGLVCFDLLLQPSVLSFQQLDLLNSRVQLFLEDRLFIFDVYPHNI
jgi:hypothetical protein